MVDSVLVGAGPTNPEAPVTQLKNVIFKLNEVTQSFFFSSTLGSVHVPITGDIGCIHLTLYPHKMKKS